MGDFIDSILASVPAHRKIEQCKFSALQAEMQDVIVDDVHNVQDGYRRIPGPRTSAENGDPVNEQLLQDDQLDIEGDSIGLIQYVVCHLLAFLSFFSFHFFIHSKTKLNTRDCQTVGSGNLYR